VTCRPLVDFLASPRLALPCLASSAPMQPQTKAILGVVQKCLALYALMELASFLKWRRRVNEVRGQEITKLTSKFEIDHWQKWFVTEMKNQPRPRELIQGVFQAPLNRISRERALHWLCWHMTMREIESYADLRYPGAIVECCDEMLSVLEDRGHFALHIDPATAWLPLTAATESTHGASAGIVDFVRIGRGSINAFYKPLLAQAVITAFRVYAEGELKGMGFTRQVDEFSIAYWIRPAVAASGSPSSRGSKPVRPLFFMHGMGFGAVPYLHFIRGLLDDRRAMVVPEWANISLGWADNHRASGLAPDLYAEGVERVVKTLTNSDGSLATCIDVIGHSFVSDCHCTVLYCIVLYCTHACLALSCLCACCS
jgi:hypothetical protein